MSETWKRMEPQPELRVVAEELLYFDDGPDGIVFHLKDGDTDRGMISGKKYRLTLVVEEAQ